jgi:hypothetical protein
MPRNLDDALRLADLLAQSTIVPKDYQGNPGNVLAAIQWGMEIGLQPLQAMLSIAVINGRPTIWGDAMLAMVKASRLLVDMQETVEEDHATCQLQRRGEAPVERTFSLNDAKRAGLLNKQGPWQQYTRHMLQMRARSWALRDVFPDVLRGVYIREEVEDETPPASEPPASTGTRTEALRQRLAMSHTKPSVSLDLVLTLIKSGDLDEADAQAALLTDEGDKKKARKAYAEARKAASDAESTVAPVAAPVPSAEAPAPVGDAHE